MDPAKLPDATRDWLGNTVSVADRDALAPALGRLTGKRVRVDATGSPVWFAQTTACGGGLRGPGPDPCLLPKACKNEVEQQGARNAHARDAVAVCRFLHFLAETSPAGSERRCPPRRSCWHCARRSQGSAAKAFRRFPARASTAPSSITA